MKKKKKSKISNSKTIKNCIRWNKEKGYKIIGYAGYHSTQNALMCFIRAAEIAKGEKFIYFNW